jgi:lipopolysaccharide export system protein LptC
MMAVARLSAPAALARAPRVRRMRLAFLAVAAAAGGVLLYFIVASSLNPPARAPQPGEDARIQMTSPRLSGRDDAGARFVVEAASASRASNAAVAIDLERPRYSTEGGSAVSGRTGRYDPMRRELILEGEVVLDNPEQETRFITDRAVVDAAASSASGQTPIEGQWPLGFVRGDAYQVLDGGRRVVFTGRVRAVIRPESGAEEETAP